MIIYGHFRDLISGQTFHAYEPGKSVKMPARCPALEHLVEEQRSLIRRLEREREAKENAPTLPNKKHAQGRLFG